MECGGAAQAIIGVFVFLLYINKMRLINKTSRNPSRQIMSLISITIKPIDQLITGCDNT